MALWTIPTVPFVDERSEADRFRSTLSQQLDAENSQLLQALFRQSARTPQGPRADAGGIRYLPDGREVWVPGQTAEERDTNFAALMQREADSILRSDPLVSEKLAKLDTLPAAKAVSLIDTIRNQDIPRLTQDKKLPARTLLDAVLQPYREATRQRAAAVERTSIPQIAWDSVKIGANEFADFLGYLTDDTAAERIKRQEANIQYTDEITANNAWLADQRLREQVGEGVLSRLVDDPVATVANVAGRGISGMGATGAAGLLAGAGAVAAGLPALAAAGAALGAGALTGAALGPGALGQRITMDPTLSLSQRLEGIRGSVPAGATYGAIEGAATALPLPVGGIPGQLGRALSGISGVSTAATSAASVVPNAALRYASGVARSAPELAAAAAIGNTAQNVAFESVTGKDTPLTENLSNAVQQGIALAPLFGLARMPRTPVETRTATGGETPQVSTPSPVPTDILLSPPVPDIARIGDMRAYVQQRFTDAVAAGEPLANVRATIPGEIVDILRSGGMDDAYIRRFATQDSLPTGMRMDTELLSRVARATQGETAKDFAVDELFASIRKANVREDPEAILSTIDTYMDTPLADPVLALAKAQSVKMTRGRKNATLSILEEKVDAARRNAASDGTQADTPVGPARPTGETGVDSTNPAVDSRVETPPGQPAPPPADAGDPRIIGSGGADESGGAGGSRIADSGPDQTNAGTPEATGVVPAANDGRPNTGPATQDSTIPDSRTGSPELTGGERSSSSDIAAGSGGDITAPIRASIADQAIGDTIDLLTNGESRAIFADPNSMTLENYDNTLRSIGVNLEEARRLTGFESLDETNYTPQAGESSIPATLDSPLQTLTQNIRTQFGDDDAPTVLAAAIKSQMGDTLTAVERNIMQDPRLNNILADVNSEQFVSDYRAMVDTFSDGIEGGAEAVNVYDFSRAMVDKPESFRRVVDNAACGGV